MKNSKAVIILSGGMDSVTTLALAKSQKFDCYAITFNYGQKSLSEIDAASYFSKNIVLLNIKYLILILTILLIRH